MQKKIKFFIPRVWLSDAYLPIVQYALRMCYDMSGKYPDQLDWCVSYVELGNVDTMWEEFLRDDPDIVCMSLYVWNAVALHALAEKIRKEFPEKIIILGGPEIHWKTHDQYWKDHPWYDYMVYGDAEETFSQLIDLIIDGNYTELNLLQIPNLIYQSKNKIVKTPHQIYKGSLYKEHSPWLYNLVDFERDCALIRANGNKPAVAWESDRGCPYNCSFCDWQAGLHHKVIQKSYSFVEELTLFAQHGCRFFSNNANTGIYEADVDIMNLVYRLSVQYPEFDPQQPSWAKINKDRVYKILKMQGEIRGSIYAKQALQSITPAVLENIDRPGTDWADQKNAILSLREETGLDVVYHAELVVGMPGETKETWDYTMLELIDLYPISNIDANHWVLLPNSPAAHPDYITKHKLNVIPTMDLFEDTHMHRMFDESLAHGQIAELLITSFAEDTLGWQGNFVNETYSSSLEDKLYMLIASGVCLNLQKLTKGHKKDSKELYKKMKPAMWNRAQCDGKRFREYYKKYKIMPIYVFYKGRIYMYREAWVSDHCFKMLTDI
jgi:radical SAM superfamily enzyme YgiQ (UPF0313 family)